MNSPLRVVLWACVGFAAAPWAHAQEATVPLAQVYQSALAHNPALLAQGQRIAALKAGRENANSLIAAPLTLEGSYRSDRNHDDQGLRETSLGLSAPLWLWNERSTNQNLRQLELAAGELPQGFHFLGLDQHFMRFPLLGDVKGQLKTTDDLTGFFQLRNERRPQQLPAPSQRCRTMSEM